MRMLPNPAGPYLVGSATCEITDSSRPAHIVSQDLGRKILVKSWYPAVKSAPGNCRRERLWEQLRGEPNLPVIAKLLLMPAMRVMTNSFHDAPYATAVGQPRILIYNHGLISFASENTMLMEHLASHGYIVISLQHKDQLAEFQTLQKAQSEEGKQEQAKIERKIKTSSGAERTALWKEYFRMASNTNRIVSARAMDMEFAIAMLDTVLEVIPGANKVSTSELVGVLGLSLGGAVATEYAKRNSKGVSCVVNMDGGIYGAHLDNPIDNRYLMLYSQENSGVNDSSLIATVRVEIITKVIPDTKHLNFHDIAAIYPVLKWLKAIGHANPISVIEQRNQLISDFITEEIRGRSG